MFNQGVFPNILKIAEVIPIFKSGKKRLIENYKPISLLPVFSKIIEKLIKTRILSFINRHDILAYMTVKVDFERNAAPYILSLM